MRKEIIGNLLFIAVVLILIRAGFRLIRSKKLTLGRKINHFLGVLLLASIISFPFLIFTWNPLRKLLQVGHFCIPFKEIQFWIEKAPQRDYYYLYARYIKSPKTESSFGHGILFETKYAFGSKLIFNPEDNKIYGKALRQGKWEFDRLGEVKFEKSIFKPIFPKGTKFTFICPEIVDSFVKFLIPVSTMSDLTVHSIMIHFPTSTLKKLTKEELEKSSLAEIFKEETKPKE